MNVVTVGEVSWAVMVCAAGAVTTDVIPTVTVEVVGVATQEQASEIKDDAKV
jgi:hypothetical protein